MIKARHTIQGHLHPLNYATQLCHITSREEMNYDKKTHGIIKFIYRMHTEFALGCTGFVISPVSGFYRIYIPDLDSGFQIWDTS